LDIGIDILYGSAVDLLMPMAEFVVVVRIEDVCVDVTSEDAVCCARGVYLGDIIFYSGVSS